MPPDSGSCAWPCSRSERSTWQQVGRDGRAELGQDERLHARRPGQPEGKRVRPRLHVYAEAEEWATEPLARNEIRERVQRIDAVAEFELVAARSLAHRADGTEDGADGGEMDGSLFRRERAHVAREHGRVRL